MRQALSVLSLLILLSGCGRKECVFQGQSMGTFYTVKVCPPSGVSQKEQTSLQEIIQSELDQINLKMSTYMESSELSRFNLHATTEPMELSPETMRVFQHSLDVSRASEGAFDVTVGPLVDAWGFGPLPRAKEQPEEATIKQLLSRVGYEKLILSESGIEKTQPDVHCDLSAIAKGYGVDRVALRLEELGLEDYLVEVGGEIRAKGNNSRGQPWKIAIEKPLPGVREIQRVLALNDLAIATSGDYRSFYEEKGIQYTHIIDPHTGYPVRSDLASVSVLHSSCAMADAYATALMVMGYEKGLALAEKLELPVLFILRESENSFNEMPSTAFQPFMEKS